MVDNLIEEEKKNLKTGEIWPMSGAIKKKGKIFTWGGYNLKPQESRIRVGTGRAGWVLGKTVVHP